MIYCCCFSSLHHRFCTSSFFPIFFIIFFQFSFSHLTVHFNHKITHPTILKKYNKLPVNFTPLSKKLFQTGSATVSWERSLSELIKKNKTEELRHNRCKLMVLVDKQEGKKSFLCFGRILNQIHTKNQGIQQLIFIKSKMSFPLDESLQKNSSKIMSFDHMPEEAKNEANHIGIWDADQQEKYVIFVDFYQRQFKSKHLRRFNKIFKTMSILVKTRDAIQCRSHHMKQLKVFKNVKNVIKNYKRKVGEENYRSAFKRTVESSAVFSEEFWPTLSKTVEKVKQIQMRDIGIQVKIEKGGNIQQVKYEVLQPSIIPINTINMGLPQMNYQMINPSWCMFPAYQ